MKKTILALSLAALSVPALAQGKKPEPEYTISGNFGLTSDYRFRGISQSDKKPAIQGGIDFAHKSGLYAGNWNSSVSDFASPRGSGIEMDFYGGYKAEVMGIGLDLGTIYYYYPGAQTGAANFKNPVNTHEVYIGLGWGPLSLKTSYTLSDRYFGLGKDADTTLQRSANSSAKGTLYYDLSFSKEVAPSLTLKAHAGFLDLNDKEAGLDYIQDFSVGLAYDMSGWVIGLNYYGTSGLSADAKAFFTTLDGRNSLLYRNGAAVSLTKTF
jgi:uncharacterized protein (TIGR02001 family)